MPAGVDQDDANGGLTSHAGQARSMIIRGFQAFTLARVEDCH